MLSRPFGTQFGESSVARYLVLQRIFVIVDKVNYGR
jgi:hypothetical protein